MNSSDDLFLSVSENLALESEDVSNASDASDDVFAPSTQEYVPHESPTRSNRDISSSTSTVAFSPYHGKRSAEDSPEHQFKVLQST